MGKGGGGGGYDTSGLEKATRQSIALQKQIYDQTRKDVQPWYNLGTGAVDRLGVLLGVRTSPSVTRESIYNELRPQYTTQQQAPTQYGGLYQDINGRVTTNKFNYDTRGNRSDPNTPIGIPQVAQNIVDTSGLNAAVDKRMADAEAAAAAARNDPQYGSLLKSFGLEDYQADPGYQFRQQEAQKALERQMASQGVTLGGGGAGQINPQAFRAMNELTQNLASQEYSNAYQRYTADNLNKFNMLMGAAGMGQGSTGILAGAGQNYAGTAGQLTTDLASAQMNAQLAKSSQPSMFGSLLGAGVQLGGMFL